MVALSTKSAEQRKRAVDGSRKTPGLPGVRPSAMAFFALAVTILAWGSAFVAIRVALRGYTPTELSVLRMGTAAAVLAAVALVNRTRMPHRRDLPHIFLVGLTGMTLYHLFLNSGEVDVPAGTASLLVATAPVFAALLARLLLNERLNRVGWGGIFLALSGSVAIALGENGGFTLQRGALLVLGASFVQATFFTIQKPLLSRYSPLEVTMYGSIIGALLLSPLGGGLPQAIGSADTAATLAVLWLAVGASVLGFVAWGYALARINVSIAVSTLYSVPVVALSVGWFLLDEVPTFTSLAGGLVALAGVALVTTKGKVH
jgi:drug/metabolite transporter (DMT)-like permease